MHELWLLRRRVAQTGVFKRDATKDLFWSHDKILLVDDSPYKALKNMQFTSIHPREWIASFIDDDELSEKRETAHIFGESSRGKALERVLPRFIKQTPYNNSNDKNKEDERKRTRNWCDALIEFVFYYAAALIIILLSTF